MDGVYDLKSLEDVIPADDEEACGTTLCVGQACHATYADGEDYEASVIFVSEDKDDCLKQMKILASKKTTKVKDHRKNTKLPAENIDSSSAKKKKTSEPTKPDKPTATKKKPNVNKQKAKKAVTLQLQSRKAAATACAKQIVEGMLERNITLVRSPQQHQSATIASPSTNRTDSTAYSVCDTSTLSSFEPISASISSPSNTYHTTSSSSNSNASISSALHSHSNSITNLSDTLHGYSSPTNTAALQPKSLLPSIASNKPHAKLGLDTSANTSVLHNFHNGSPNGHYYRNPSLAGLENSSYPDQHNSYLSMLYSQPSPPNPVSSTNDQLDGSHFPVQPVMHTIAPSITQSAFPGASAWTVGPENQTACNTNQSVLPCSTMSSHTMSSQADHTILPTNLNPTTSYMSACNNCTLLNERNRVLASENNILKADIEHLKKKYQEAIKGIHRSDKGNILEPQEYKPGRGYRSTKADYEIISIGESLGPGKERFGGATSKVVVTSSWLSRMQAKTKKSTASCKVKRYMDGFFQPWEMQGLNSSIVSQMTGEKKEIFLALETFASEECGLSASSFNKCLNAKAGTAKRAMHLVFPESAIPKKDKPKKKNNSGDNNDI